MASTEGLSIEWSRRFDSSQKLKNCLSVFTFILPGLSPAAGDSSACAMVTADDNFTSPDDRLQCHISLSQVTMSHQLMTGYIM